MDIELLQTVMQNRCSGRGKNVHTKLENINNLSSTNARKNGSHNQLI